MGTKQDLILCRNLVVQLYTVIKLAGNKPSAYWKPGLQMLSHVDVYGGFLQLNLAVFEYVICCIFADKSLSLY